MSDDLRTVLDRERELRLLADLCRELVKLGIAATLSDARPAVRVRVGGNWAGLSVLMDSDADMFTWGEDQTHAISDRAGAAVAIAAYVKQLEAAEVTTSSSEASALEPGSEGSDAGTD